MLIAIPGVLDAQALVDCRTILDNAEWLDGDIAQSARSAQPGPNRRLPEDGEPARRLGNIVLDALGRSPLFIASALPLKIYPPMFDRHAGGAAFAAHVDNAIRIRPGSDFRLRSDISATLFLAAPDSYDGGDLVIEGKFGAQSVKLGAGDMIVYPSSSLRRVVPVTRGERTCCSLWIQSMIRDDDARRTLFDLDQSIQSIAIDRGQADPDIIRLTGVYHNLLRHWADA